MAKLVEMRNIFKSYGGVLALKGINFEVGQNEVVGLLGDNGAGKSSLIKIIAGVHPFDDGEMYIRGVKINPGRYSVKKAHDLGIETVYQEKALADKQALWRNIFIGRQITTWLGILNIRKEKQETNRILRDSIGFRGVGAGADSFVQTLSGGERQGVAISRAMYFDAELVILDEPTIGLSLQEVKKVLAFIQDIKDRGKSCICISHNIASVYPVSDRFVVVDRGSVAGSYERSTTSMQELTDAMVGHVESARQRELGERKSR
jgi:simple sugar transport system ATP-binding protein